MTKNHISITVSNITVINTYQKLMIIYASQGAENSRSIDMFQPFRHTFDFFFNLLH